MKYRWLLFAIGIGLFLVACTTMSDADWARLAELISKANEGTLTPAEQTEMSQLTSQATSGKLNFDWGNIVSSIITLVLGYFGIRVWRGPITARKGTVQGVN